MNNSITLHPENLEQEEALKAVAKALNIRFEISKEQNYDPSFVNKVLKSRESAQKGDVTRVNKEDLTSLLGV